MNFYKYLIIGGGIAGTTAAEAIRKYDPDGSLIIIEDEKYPLYSRMSLFDWICEPTYGDKIFLRKSDDYKNKNIDLLLDVRAEKIDAVKRDALLSDGQTLNFEKLLVSSGGMPRKLEIVADGEENIFYYRNLDDAKKIKEKLPYLKKVAVIGASLGALELAELFRKFDIEVDIFVRSEFLRGLADENTQKYIKEVFEKNKINIKRGKNINYIKNENGKVIVRADEEYIYDGAALSVGFERNQKIFEDAGIKCGNGIITDEYLMTNFDGIYAAGDVTVYPGSWHSAFMQGKIAGENMAGVNPKKKIKINPIYTCWIFDRQFTFTP